MTLDRRLNHEGATADIFAVAATCGPVPLLDGLVSFRFGDDRQLMGVGQCPERAGPFRSQTGLDGAGSTEVALAA